MNTRHAGGTASAMYNLAKKERDEALDALAALHNCIVWSDSYGQFVVAFPGRMPEVLNQVRPVLEKHGRRVF